MKATHAAGEFIRYSISGLFSMSTNDTLSLYCASTVVTSVNGDSGNLSIIG